MDCKAVAAPEGTVCIAARTGADEPMTAPLASRAWTTNQGPSSSTRMLVSKPSLGAVVSSRGSAPSDGAPITRQELTLVAPFQLT